RDRLRAVHVDDRAVAHVRVRRRHDSIVGADLDPGAIEHFGDRRGEGPNLNRGALDAYGYVLFEGTVRHGGDAQHSDERSFENALTHRSPLARLWPVREVGGKTGGKS